jgi:hypothetical protein
MNPVSRSWVRYYDSASDYNHKLNLAIYQCNDDKPPSRLIESVKPFCEASFKIETPYIGLADHVTTGGNHVKMLEFDIQMIPSGASIEFVVLHKGKRVGSQSIDIKFE